VTIGCNVGSKAEVDAAFKQALEHGAKKVKEPSETFYGGYAGYFLGIDGHMWKIVFNPDFI